VQWFSTRCFLIDRVRLSNYLPLARGRYYLEVLLRKWLNRSYPPDVEMMLFHTLRPRGGFRIDLTTDRAWIVHPAQKDEKFIRLLPKLILNIAHGKVPPNQLGRTDLCLDKWSKYLESAPE
jgi:hypothetical protein